MGCKHLLQFRVFFRIYFVCIIGKVTKAGLKSLWRFSIAGLCLGWGGAGGAQGNSGRLGEQGRQPVVGGGPALTGTRERVPPHILHPQCLLASP